MKLYDRSIDVDLFHCLHSGQPVLVRSAAPSEQQFPCFPTDPQGKEATMGPTLPLTDPDPKFAGVALATGSGSARTGPILPGSHRCPGTAAPLRSFARRQAKQALGLC
jgi:hypothetical protein